MKILKNNNKEEEKILRTPTKPFDVSKYSREEIRELLKTMRSIMREANGVGLSANQIGMSVSVFVAQVENKFYAIFNPKITKASGKVDLEEGCLSVPKAYGTITRAEKVTLEGQDQNGKKIKIKAWGLLAQVFQHEVGHLQGKLFIDQAKKLFDPEELTDGRLKKKAHEEKPNMPNQMRKS